MTELTIDQALQKGIEAHKAGQVQEANRLYTAILKAQPKHPYANHSMGVLAVGVGKVKEALPFFKTALESNPATAQFWLSYVNILIKLDQLADAKAVLDQAKSKGARGDGFDKLELRLKEVKLENPVGSRNTAPEEDQEQHNILDTLKLDQAIKLAKTKAKKGYLEEAKRIYQNILAKFPKNKRASDGLEALAGEPVGRISQLQEPSEDQLQSLMKFYSKGQLQQALKQAKTLIQQFPRSPILYNFKGAALKGLGHLDLSIDAYKKALAIKPDYAEAYYNMGNALKKHGRLDEAIEAYSKALTIKPDKADAYKNMGSALKEQGQLEEAIKAYNNVLAIKPDSVDVLHMVSALTGRTTNTAPRNYVESLFDRYAENFDYSLLNELEYRAPKLISNLAVHLHGEGSMGKILDLGCGTGLLGMEVKEYCSDLEGLDLSGKMLEQARNKNIYNKLSHIEIVEYLSEAELDFDYFMSADVFVYVGDLSDVFRLIKSKNKRSARLVFSTEHTELDGFHLEQTGRYSHSKSYIESLCSKFDYSMFHFSTAPLRSEKGKFLEGGMYVLDF